MVQRADSIVVGTIVKLDIVAKPPEGSCLALMRVQLQIENVLKGSPSDQTLTYYYFGPWCGTMGPVESLHVNSRSIFFLRGEQGYWRALGDYWQNRLPVRSGRHPKAFGAGNPIERVIADVLLIPGEQYSAAAFAMGIQTEASFTARTLVGAARTDQLLRSLLIHPEMDIRAVACLVLKENQATDDCAAPILSWYLDRFARGDFTGISGSVVGRLDFLKAYVAPATRSQAEYLLFQARVATTLPGPPKVTLPDVLIR